MTDNTQILDDLRRASEMEEIMNMTLSDICTEILREADFSPETKERMGQILNTIHKDTLRHMAIVGDIMKEIKEGALDE